MDLNKSRKGLFKKRVEKFLINKKGYPVARYSSEIEPESPILVEQIEHELDS